MTVRTVARQRQLDSARMAGIRAALDVGHEAQCPYLIGGFSQALAKEWYRGHDWAGLFPGPARQMMEWNRP